MAATGTPTGSGLPMRRGGRSRPGAADDALGLAAMLENARLFAAGPRPQRTLVFAAWTAEERGLLGSEYYAQHPLFPMEKMVANLTFDTLQWNGPVKDAVLVGRGQSGDMEALLAERGEGAGPLCHRREPSRARPVLPRRPFLLRQARRAGAARYGAGRRLRHGRRRAAGGREMAEQLHVDLLPPDLRCLVAELEPARRGAGGGAVLRDRQPPREQPRLAAMGRVVGIRQGAGAECCPAKRRCSRNRARALAFACKRCERDPVG